MTTLITDEQRVLLLANGRESLQNTDFDPAAAVKLLTPDAGVTWLVTEIDPDDPQHAFGLCDLGLGAPRWDGMGQSSETDACAWSAWVPVARDQHFCAGKWLRAYARDTRLVGRIDV